MINVSQSSNSLPPHAVAYTLIELLVTITVIIILGTMVLGKIGAAGSIAEKKVIYLQNRDALVAMPTITNGITLIQSIPMPAE